MQCLPLLVCWGTPIHTGQHGRAAPAIRPGHTGTAGRARPAQLKPGESRCKGLALLSTGSL